MSTLAAIAYALLAPGPEAGTGGDAGAEVQWLRQHRRNVLAGHADAVAAANDWSSSPPAADARLHALCRELEMHAAEALALALSADVETDPMAGRALAWLQHPAGGSRPTPGLVAALSEMIDPGSSARAFAAITAGRARECGLLLLDGEARPLPEQTLRTPAPLVFAIAGLPSRWPGIETALPDAPPLAPSQEEQARRYATALAQSPQVLAIRSGHPQESRAIAGLLARALDAEPAFVGGEAPAGLGCWLAITGRVPVICAELVPGERRALPELAGYRGPVLVATGPDGVFDSAGRLSANWRVEPPRPEERVELWRAATGAEALAALSGRAFRHSAGRIDGLARAARFQAALAGREQPQAADLIEAGRNGAAADLGALAELMPQQVDEHALVLPPALRAQLDQVAHRCLSRDTLAAALGVAARTRYCPGVRVLLHGPSGTGKTLAVSWLASRLGLPLYRVDLASVTSKYIGETEKNLAQLFARAEHAEVVLMFDEADSLFGKRTDVRDSNDRFANAQTNYLLQRIESFEGIAVLTSNSRARFDGAFVRRLDAIIEFPAPAPEERRALWAAHLGEQAALGVVDLNRLAAGCDLAGGHIRNVVFAAAASAQAQQQPLGAEHLRLAVAAEYRKLGKNAPVGF